MTDPSNPLANRLAIIFDFDETLVPDSFKFLLHNLGLDAGAFQLSKEK